MRRLQLGAAVVELADGTGQGDETRAEIAVLIALPQGVLHVPEALVDCLQLGDQDRQLGGLDQSALAGRPQSFQFLLDVDELGTVAEARLFDVQNGDFVQ